MIGFFLKKSFFDGWDHLFTLVLLNGVFIAIAALGMVLPSALGLSGLPAFLPQAVALLALCVWWAACVRALVSVADFGSVKPADMLAALGPSVVPGLQMGAVLVLALALLSIGIPFYLTNGGVVGALAAGVLFWCAATLALALQWYLPLRARLGGGFRKNLRKSMVLFFDNPGFSIFLFAYTLLTLVLSFFLAFMAPGPAGAALGLDVALRLRLRKYDWLEANPGANRKAVPWKELLEEDAELVGTRTLKGMIFPWKE